MYILPGIYIYLIHLENGGIKYSIFLQSLQATATDILNRSQLNVLLNVSAIDIGCQHASLTGACLKGRQQTCKSSSLQDGADACKFVKDIRHHVSVGVSFLFLKSETWQKQNVQLIAEII